VSIFQPFHFAAVSPMKRDCEGGRSDNARSESKGYEVKVGKRPALGWQLTGGELRDWGIRNQGDSQRQDGAHRLTPQSCQKELNAYFLNVHIDPVKDAPQAIQKQTSKQLVFKGNMRKDLEDWLTQKGF
jgi:hypothetical protein